MDPVVGDNLSRTELRDWVERLLAEVAPLRQEVQQLRARTLQLEAENDQLKRQLAAARKNSSNSSKPPSNDITKPSSGPTGRRRSKRKRGGQPGHPKHERPPLNPDDTHDYVLDACPDCGGRLTNVPDGTRTTQQLRMVARPIHVDEHRGHAYFCKHCNKLHYAPLPLEVAAGGLFDSTLTALVGYLKGACHASFSTIRKFFRDVLHVTVSRGYLAKITHKVSGSLESAYETLKALLPTLAAVHIDETGLSHGGKRHWVWCFRSGTFVLFRITDSRSADILWDMLGADFGGVIGCDYFSAYRKYMKNCDIRVQFCLAHLIRELKYLITLPDAATRDYGQRLLDQMRTLFAIIHRGERMSEARLIAELADQRERILYEAQRDVPPTREAMNLAKRFALHGQAYFQFILTPEIAPTNNLAEQAIRFVVIDRLITQGTRSEAGQRWCERIWTVLATCAQQGRSAFAFLLDSVHAFLNSKPPPELVPNSS